MMRATFAGVMAACLAMCAYIVGAYVTPAPVDVPGIPYSDAPCAAEDGPVPCYWNAAERGNGIGRSYYLAPDESVHYVD